MQLVAKAFSEMNLNMKWGVEKCLPTPGICEIFGREVGLSGIPQLQE